MGAGSLVGAAALHPESLLCTTDRVAQWHEDGFAVNAWTADEPDELLRLAEVGVDAVCTNEPALAASLYDRFTASPRP
jgi:glycerophosphoryl diester phosphodiesterase